MIALFTKWGWFWEYGDAGQSQSDADGVAVPSDGLFRSN
jgi:hypothetical protein